MPSTGMSLALQLSTGTTRSEAGLRVVWSAERGLQDMSGPTSHSGLWSSPEAAFPLRSPAHDSEILRLGKPPSTECSAARLRRPRHGNATYRVPLTWHHDVAPGPLCLQLAG